MLRDHHQHQWMANDYSGRGFGTQWINYATTFRCHSHHHHQWAKPTHTELSSPRAATQSPIPFCGDEFNWYRTSVTRMLSQKPFTESEKGSRPEKQFGRTGPTLISRVSLCNYPIIGIWIFMYGDMVIWTHWSHLYIQWLDGNRNAEIMSPGQQNQQVNQTNWSWTIKHTNTDGLDGIEHTLSH